MIVTIHQINVTTQLTRDTQEIPSSESPLLQLLSKCSNCQFSHLAALLLRESMGRVILIGVKLIRQASEQTFKSKLVFSNPGSHVPLSSCQALFVISSTKLLAKKMLLTVLKKYVSSHPPCEGATPSSPKEPLYPCVSRLVSGRLSELKNPGPESHVLDLEETPELLQLCPFIRLEKDPTIAEAQQYEFFGHLVIIFSSSGSKDLVPPTALLMQILDFLESYRYYTHYPVPPDIPSSKVIIFSERADELVALTERMEFSQSSLLAGVSFYLGSPKNIDHLRLCRVVAAKTVVVLQPPVTYHSWITSSSSPLPSINEDKHTIVVSLNIHHLVHTALTQEMGSTPRPRYSVEQIVLNGFEDDNLRLPFFAAHLHDITNASYLLPHGQFYPPEREFSFLPHRDDWNLISSGGIIAQSLLYSLLLHSILIPDIIALWEDLLSFPEDKTDNPSPSHPLPKIQRVKCPRNRIGWKYYDFLEDLITVEGDIDHIPIAVHRQHVPGTHDRVRFPDCLCRSLPYLLLAPEPDFTLQEADFIFFISCP